MMMDVGEQLAKGDCKEAIMQQEQFPTISVSDMHMEKCAPPGYRGEHL